MARQPAGAGADRAGGGVPGQRPGPGVARTQDAVHADYEMGLEIRDFAAHYGAEDKDNKPSGNPKISVILIAQMTTAHGRKIVANFTASQSADASQNSTAAVVQAMNTALTAAVQQIVSWALTMTAPDDPVAGNFTLEPALSSCRILKDMESDMLRWALIFLVIGLIAGVLGFTGVAGTSIAIAKVLFFIFLAVFLVLMVAGLTVARKVTGTDAMRGAAIAFGTGFALIQAANAAPPGMV